MRSKQADARDVADHPLKQEHMSPALREAAFALMQLKTEEWQLEFAWGQSLHAKVLSRLKQHEGTAAVAVEGSPASQN